MCAHTVDQLVSNISMEGKESSIDVSASAPQPLRLPPRGSSATANVALAAIMHLSRGFWLL
jgi:hypothetical protein